MTSPLHIAWQHLFATRYGQAIKLCDAILAQQPNNPSALTCRATARWSAGGDIAAALADLNKAAALAPKDSAIRHNLATVVASTGDFAEAEKQFRQALKLNRDDASAFMGLTQIRKLAPDDPLVERFRTLYDSDRLKGVGKEHAAFGLARVYDAAGQAEPAMRYCLAANALANRPYAAEKDTRRLAALRELVEAGAFTKLARAAAEGPAPIFVVGMPRSGTTLVESLLAAPDDVYGAGEAGLVTLAEREIMEYLGKTKGFSGSPDAAVLELGADVFTRAGKLIRQRVEKLAGHPVGRFVDKTPHHSLSIGLIAAMFPHAKVIYIRRHPLDCGLSNLFTRFHVGQGFAFSQESIGAHFRVVAETVALWKRSGLIDILDVSYEHLVADPEPQAQRLFAFAGLDWDPAYLDFAGMKRTVRTASVWQVRQPIYSSSVARWRRYEQWLDPMIAAMGGMAWIESYMDEMAAG